MADALKLHVVSLESAKHSLALSWSDIDGPGHIVAELTDSYSIQQQLMEQLSRQRSYTEVIEEWSEEKILILNNRIHEMRAENQLLRDQLEHSNAEKQWTGIRRDHRVPDGLDPVSADQGPKAGAPTLNHVEVQTLRHRVEALEQENGHLRDEVQSMVAENRTLRRKLKVQTRSLSEIGTLQEQIRSMDDDMHSETENMRVQIEQLLTENESLRQKARESVVFEVRYRLDDHLSAAFPGNTGHGAANSDDSNFSVCSLFLADRSSQRSAVELSSNEGTACNEVDALTHLDTVDFIEDVINSMDSCPSNKTEQRWSGGWNAAVRKWQRVKGDRKRRKSRGISISDFWNKHGK